MWEIVRAITYTFFLTCIACDKVSYNGQKVVRLTVDDSDLERINTWLKRRDIDVWNSFPSNEKNLIDVQLPSEDFQNFMTKLNKMNVKSETLIHDLQDELDIQEILRNMRRQKRSSKFPLDHYHTLEEIYEYIDSLSKQYPDTTVSSIGTTVQGRDIKEVYIGKGDKKVVAVDCGIHAREWITQATCLYILDQLLAHDDEKDVSTLRQRYDWLIMPVLNPDGYSFTWTDDRMHRKNMAGFNEATGCGGVDLNRNMGVNFCGIGASGDPCDETYCGPYAFSERETSAERDRLQSIAANVTAFFSLHSYSQVWMIPYGYTAEKPKDYNEMERVAKIGVDAIKRTHGRYFRYGNTYSAVYPSSGGNRDWIYKVLHIVYTYGLEMRDTGRYGFLLPDEQIIPAAQETWNGIKAAVLSIPYI